MKVRLLYFAHLYNIPLSPELEEDLAVILQKIPLLHGELISKTFIMERILFELLCSPANVRQYSFDFSHGYKIR